MKKTIIFVTICMLLAAGCACAGTVQTEQRESNLAAYLFGGTQPSSPAQKVPLTLPARVGVAFVPGDPATAPIPETTRKEVMDSVRAELARHTKYVASTQAIPSSYLRPKGGISDLEQVARQFEVDVIVLLAANQFQRNERNSLAAFLDLTVIGYFALPGTTVDTATVLEAAVYHVPSRALIFRADGAAETSSLATGYGTEGRKQRDAVTSISGASKKLVTSIAEALLKFEKFDVANAEEIRPQAEAPEQKGTAQENYWGRVSRYRSTGGGSMDAIWLIVMGGAALCSARIRARR